MVRALKQWACNSRRRDLFNNKLRMRSKRKKREAKSEKVQKGFSVLSVRWLGVYLLLRYFSFEKSHSFYFICISRAKSQRQHEKLLWNGSHSSYETYSLFFRFFCSLRRCVPVSMSLASRRSFCSLSGFGDFSDMELTFNRLKRMATHWNKDQLFFEL